MPFSGSVPIPGFKVPDPPDVDLGFPLRHSAKAKQSIGEAIKGAYVSGGLQGYSIGQTVGYAGGHVAGVVEGSAITAVIFGSIFFCSCILMRLARK
jgi:hypothetical protein